MKLELATLTLALTLCAVGAAQPQLKTLAVTIDPYPLSNYPGGSNAVITLYKSTSLGTVWTPFKPTTVFPATRTNQNFQVVAPNTFRFQATATIQPYGESDPSERVTNIVTLTTMFVRTRTTELAITAPKPIIRSKGKTNEKAYRTVPFERGARWRRPGPTHPVF